MRMNRRAALTLIAGLPLAAPALAQRRSDPATLRVKLFGDLRSLDPSISPEY